MLLRTITAALLIILLFSQQVSAFSLVDAATEKIIQETWNAQTLDQLQNGIVAVPESAINDYLSTVLPDYPDIQATHVTIGSANKIILDIKTKKAGRMKLQGTITSFVQNKDQSAVSIVIEKRKLQDKPIASWFFSHISVGMLTKLFGNPLSDHQDCFITHFEGNTLYINFKPYIDKSPLSTANIMGIALADLFRVDSITTEDGVVYLHTSLNAPQSVLTAVQRILY